MSHSIAFFGVGPLAQLELDVPRQRDDGRNMALCDQDRRTAEQVAAG